jgi:selenide,water dikinase
VQYANAIPEEIKTILFDPQTAGGLLVSAAPEAVGNLIRALTNAGVPAAEIGEVLPRADHLIIVT